MPSRAAALSPAFFSPRCQAAAAGDDENVLDEAAMRAAEIHEVLVGLADFKARIIAGKVT
jgi:hypothetical protein